MAVEGPAGASHRFVLSTALRTALEAKSVPLPARGPDDLARIACENHKTVCDGKWDVPPTDIFKCPAEDCKLALPCDVTEVCVANVDTLTALLTVQELRGADAGALNFANARHAGGGYRGGARAQEEDLCRLIPELYESLVQNISRNYPMRNNWALVTKGVQACRHVGTYQWRHEQEHPRCCIISAAMPNLGPTYDHEVGGLERRIGKGDQVWWETARDRVRAILSAAAESQMRHLVLGAFGCGAFRNEPQDVANVFVEALMSPEFRGAFKTVVFAIVDPKADSGWPGNFSIFEKVLENAFGAKADVDKLKAQWDERRKVLAAGGQWWQGARADKVADKVAKA